MSQKSIFSKAAYLDGKGGARPQKTILPSSEQKVEPKELVRGNTYKIVARKG